MLNALFLWFGRLITNICVVKRLLGQNAIECGDSSVLLNLLESLNFGFVDINDDGAVDFINLMQIADSALDELDENKCLDDRISSGPDGQLLVRRLGVEDSECVAEITADLACDSNSDLVLGGFLFLLLHLLVSLHLSKLRFK